MFVVEMKLITEGLEVDTEWLEQSCHVDLGGWLGRTFLKARGKLKA
jgi:hypothetical protein